MEEYEKNDLFEIKLNEEGATYIRKLSKTTVVILAMMILLTVFGVIVEIYYLIQTSRLQFQDNREFIKSQIISYTNLIITVINFIGIYYYLKFIRELHRGPYSGNTDLFNRSFKYFYFNIMIFSSVLALTLFQYAMSLPHVIKSFL